MYKQIERYEAILTSWLETFVSHRQHLADTEYTLVTDTVHHHFQVVRIGWVIS
ncbi:XisI protein [Fibrella sp. HMF5335]|uniref:XisI protein n=1 Tax=Fibrella rubiginis TaxID=2817060 RepID=A0A939GFX5_9BACT|nr:XisI protein [Fibrella rubiginis]